MQYLQMCRFAISTTQCDMNDLVKIRYSCYHVHITPAAWSKYLPSSHKTQVCDPEVVLYFPVSQDEQGPPSMPAYPGTHLQCVMSELPAGASEKGVQVKQNDIPEALEYVPRLQICGLADPMVSLKLPGTQGVQDPPSGPVYPTLQEQSC
jgi:hypothetical protein